METIEDIVREMREFATRHWMHDEGLNIGRFADRIEAAAKRKNCHEDGLINTLSIELCKVKSEDARLRASLQPVLACDSDIHRDGVNMIGAFNAVRECQRIYGERGV